MDYPTLYISPLEPWFNGIDFGNFSGEIHAVVLSYKSDVSSYGFDNDLGKALLIKLLGDTYWWRIDKGELVFVNDDLINHFPHRPKGLFLRVINNPKISQWVEACRKHNPIIESNTLLECFNSDTKEYSFENISNITTLGQDVIVAKSYGMDEPLLLFSNRELKAIANDIEHLALSIGSIGVKRLASYNDLPEY